MCLFDLSTTSLRQYIENLRDTRHLSESHRKLVKNVDFSKQMFPGINKKEQDRVRARFSMDVTKGVSSWAILRAGLSAERLISNYICTV
jgi:hypothetical protein